jgi:hypothetical protein
MNLQNLESTIAVLEGNIRAIELMHSSELADLEETEDFQKLTQRNLDLILIDLQDYLNALLQTKEKLETNGSILPSSEPSTGQQRKQHDPEFESALSDVFGGFNVFG